MCREIVLLSGLPGGSDGKEPACSAADRVPSLGQGDPLEKRVAARSSILARRIPWTEESGGLQSMGLQSQTRLSDTLLLQSL